MLKISSQFSEKELILSVTQISTSMVIATFKPPSPAIVPNPQNVIQEVISSKSTYVVVSLLLKLLNIVCFKTRKKIHS